MSKTNSSSIPLQIKKSTSSLHNFETLLEQEQEDDINIYTHYYPRNEIKVEYKTRRSILDDYHPDSKLRKSVFYGYFQLVFMFSCYFFVCHPIKKYIDEGYFLEINLFNWVVHDVFDCLMLWPYMILYLHLAYFLVKLRLPILIEKMIQFTLLVSCIYLFAFWYTFTLHPNWLYTSRAFAAICTLAVFMKTHSYIQENRVLIKKDKNYKTKYGEFFYFVLVPATIFQRQYPRNEKKEWKFIIIKFIFSCLGIMGIYILSTDWLIPVVNSSSEKDFMTLLLELIEICFYFNFVVFYMIFESIMQVVSEMTRFSDREFYRDWWNSTSYNDYVQKYNRPVDDFSRRYIHEPLLKKYKLNQKVADFFLGTFSVLCYEFSIIFTTRAFTPFILFVLIIQIPFYSLFRKLEGTDWGNIVFWFIYLLAVPIITTLYIKVDEWFI